MDGHGRSSGGFGVDRDDSVMLIVGAALEHGVENPRQIAYMLATAQHETRDFSAPDEDFGRSQARKLGYSGGEEFFGRGYVHLTHDYNYRKFDELLGLDGELVRNPARAKDPELAATILVVGMRDGLFTGRRLDRYINDEMQDAYNARRVVNGITRQAWTIKAAEDCERYAKEWEPLVPGLIERSRLRQTEAPRGWQHDLEQVLKRLVPGSRPGIPVLRDGLPDYLRPYDSRAGDARFASNLQQGARGERVRELQQALVELDVRDGQGRPLAVDGIFGPGTRQAVENFQLWSGLETSGVVNRDTRDLLRDGPGPALASEAADDAATPAHPSAPLDPRDPDHPDHALYDRIRAGIRAIGERNGHPYDDSSERVSRCLLAECRPALRRVDHVVMGTSGKVFAIEGRLDDPAQRRAWVSFAEAALVPVDASDDRLAQANRLAAREEMAAVSLRQPAALHAPAPTPALP